MKILVIGDSCTDIFRYGNVDRLAPEGPIPIIKPIRETSNPGMAGNVVANLESLGAEVDFITNDIQIKKIRYVCAQYNHLLLRVDENDKCERYDGETFIAVDYDAIVISDYCKGFLTEEDIELWSNNDCPVFLDTKKLLGDWCSCIDFIKINFEEYLNNENILIKDSKLNNKVITTRGKHGCEYKGKTYPTIDVPVKDISGAGDTFLAGLVYEYVNSKNIEKAIEFAQICTTKVVQKPGVSVV